MKVPAIVKKKKREAPLEKDVEKYFRIEVGRVFGYKTWKFSSPTQRGVFDRILIGSGMVVFVELKRVKKLANVSAKQDTFYREAVEEGGSMGCFVYGHAGVDAFIKDLTIIIDRRATVNALFKIGEINDTIVIPQLKREYH